MSPLTFDSNTIIVGVFNILLSSVDRSSRQKIKKETKALNDTLDQMKLTDIYRAFHPKAVDYFSYAHRIFSRTDHILGHKVSLGKFKRIKIVSSIFSDDSTMRLEIKHKKKTLRNTNLWWLNSMLLNNHWITEGIKKCLEKK